MHLATSAGGDIMTTPLRDMGSLKPPLYWFGPMRRDATRALLYRACQPHEPTVKCSG